MSKAYLLRELKWDSGFFGINCAKIELFNTISLDEWIEINKSLQIFDFVTIISSDDKNNIYYLSSMKNCYLVDVPLILRLNKLEINDSNEKILNYLTLVNKDDKNSFEFDKIEKLASNSFHNSRFYRDLEIEELLANKLYSNWIKNSIDNDQHYFIVHKSSLGFLLFTQEIDSIDILLISVDADSRGKGIASQLIDVLVKHAISMNIQSITVSTQAHNLRALNLYTKLGFKFEKIFYTFHYHKGMPL